MNSSDISPISPPRSANVLPPWAPCTPNGTPRSTSSPARTPSTSTCTTCCTASPSPAWSISHPGARILDAGTGGGFPGIPLAVLFPQVHFTLVDSIGKKTKVAADIARQLSLENVSVVNARIESLPEQYDFVVSRARSPHGEDRRLDAGKDPAGKSVEPSQRHPLSEGRRPGRRTRPVPPGENLRHISLFL